MILIEDVLRLHNFSIADYGGSAGVRDTGLMESAIARPYSTLEVKIYTCHLLIRLLLCVKV